MDVAIVILAKKPVRTNCATLPITLIYIKGEMKPRSGVAMKNVCLVTGVLVLLVVVCSPSLAISKNDLISYYRGQSSPSMPIPTPTPTLTPTSLTGTGTIYVTCNHEGASVYLDGVYTGVTPSGAYIIGPNLLTLNGIPAGLHQLKVAKEGYCDSSIRVIVTEGETSSVFAYLIRNPPSGKLTIMELVPSYRQDIPWV